MKPTDEGERQGTSDHLYPGKNTLLYHGCLVATTGSEFQDPQEGLASWALKYPLQLKQPAEEAAWGVVVVQRSGILLRLGLVAPRNTGSPGPIYCK